MKLQVVGCSHHTSSVAVRERLAFDKEQARDALKAFSDRFPAASGVILSTCNRVELYSACETVEKAPTHQELVEFLAGYHGLNSIEIFSELFERTGEDAVRHLFAVASGLDSMVVGEAQILAQVKQAHHLAREVDQIGPLDLVFQNALRVAKRIATETAIQQGRVSIPSVAVSEFARSVFESFADKVTLVIGAGEMAEETLIYLQQEGVQDLRVVNRNLERAEDLAKRFNGLACPWERLDELLVECDLVVTATGAAQPIVTVDRFRRIEAERRERPIFVLDLAVPRDFEPRIAQLQNVYLYSIDDLKQVCEENRRQREKEWPKAERILEEETRKFVHELHRRETGSTIQRFKSQAEETKVRELERLMAKLERLDPEAKAEIGKAFDRLVNKILHPPLQSLKEEAESGTPHTLLAALRRLFQIKD